MESLDPISFLVDGNWLSEHRTFTPEPETRLIIAIIEDAIHCATHPGKNTEEAREWIEAPASDWIFSFEHVCDALSLAPAPARRRIMAMAGYTLPAPIIPVYARYERRRGRPSGHANQLTLLP